MDNRINDAEDELYDLEDSISGILEAFDSQTDYGHLIDTKGSDAETMIIRFPGEIKVCKDCDALYDKKRGCECQR
jgi:hypothetical protein